MRLNVLFRNRNDVRFQQMHHHFYGIPKMKIDTTLLWPLAENQDGFVISVELLLIATLALLGIIVGLSAVRDAAISELSDVAGSVQDINQCYSFAGIVGHSSTNHGSDYNDALDFCDDADDVAGAADNCITFDGDPSDEATGGTGGVTTTDYENSDSTTDISASQNATTLKWELEPGQEDDADAVTQAIIDCIEAGHVAEITWSNTAGDTFTFSADTIVSGGPETFGFTGTGGGSGSGKMTSATVECSTD